MIRHPVTFLFIFPPSLCLRRHDFSIRRAALNVVLLHTLGAQMHFTPAMSLMATLSILSCRCRMQMSAGCLRDGKRVTNDASPSPIAVAFPCAQVRHDTANNLRCTSCGVVQYIHAQPDWDLYPTECWIQVCVHSRLLLQHWVRGGCASVFWSEWKPLF